MDEVDAVGDIISGAVIAGAVEGATPLVDGHTAEGACLNCGAVLAGRYCVECGQKSHVHRTLGAFGHDLAHGLFHVDGKLWHTLPLLAWKPGELTRRYIDGQRVRFISPIALFLFTVFLMFAALGLNGGIKTDDFTPTAGSIDSAVTKQREAIADLQEKLAKARRTNAPTAAIEREIASEQDDLKLIEAVRDRKIVGKSSATFGAGVPQWMQDAVNAAARNPELALYKVQSKAYKLSWLLIPLSVPFLWLMFPFSRRFRLYDHTVFVTYSLSFMMMLATLACVMAWSGWGAAAAFLLVVPPVHMYRQLKGTYQLGRAGALVRTLLLVAFAFTATVLFMLAVVGAGLTD